ncbi:MAG: DNA-3-methyladenine glycosylase I [Lachnospiraceae bacterium]|jgi:DNA-3-methyladenine glycosylase I
MSYCDWDSASDIVLRYHDEEWGVPLHDDQKQFEFLMMEVMQCGLNWTMMMNKREIFRQCFDNFDFDKVAAYDESDIARILNTPGMIRSRRKVEAVINDARCFQKIRAEFGTFSEYLWGWSGGKTILYNRHPEGWIPTSNGLSDRISRDLKKRGFRYLGSVTVYSHLQACGIINDHDRNCPCYDRINAANPTVHRRREKEHDVHYYG